MKIKFMFQDQELGEAEAEKGSGVILCRGAAARSRVNWHADKSGKSGEDLLRYILAKEGGRNWAYEVKEQGGLPSREEGLFPDLAKPQKGSEVGRLEDPTTEKDDYGRDKTDR